MDFKEYWYKYWPKQNREYARRRWNEYQDVLKISTDYNITKDELIKNNMNTVTANTVQVVGWAGSMSGPSNFFVDCKAATAPCQMAECNTSYECKTNKQKGNNPMYVDNDKHIESSKINYLNDRLNNSYFQQERKIPEAFNLNVPKVPDTAEKLVAAITSGNYSIKPKAEQSPYHRATENIVWRSPSIVPDQAGADAAEESLSALLQTAKDTIAVGTPADALTAIKAIDAFTPVTTVAATTATA